MQDSPVRASFDADNAIELPEEDAPRIKLDRSKSKFAKQPDTKVQFQKQAEDVHEHLQQARVDAVQLGQEFMKFFNSKILPDNIGPIEKSFQQEIMKKLINFAIETNNDPYQEQDGMGSVGMITLLFNSLFKIKNKCNLLEYSYEQLASKVAGLEKELSSFKAQNDEQE